MNRRILLTGATGFIGSHLVRRLVVDGWVLHILVRAHSDLTSIGEVRSQIQVHVITGCITELDSLVSKIKPTVTIHLASLFLSGHKMNDVDRLINSNVLFPSQLLEVLSKNGCLNFINTGTSWQHFTGQAYDPVNLYSATKQCFEDILAFYTNVLRFKCITFKLYDTYGPNDLRKKLMGLLSEASRSGKSLNMSPGLQQIDLVYIDDVIEAYVIAVNMLTHGSVKNHEQYVISTKQPITLRDLVNLYAELSKRPINVKWGANSYRQREIMEPITTGQWINGWVPKVDIRNGLLKIINYIR